MKEILKVINQYCLTEKVSADKYVIACGPWNRTLLPKMLKDKTYISRQEVYYFGVPNDSVRKYNLESMPCWLDLNADNASYYGIPSIITKVLKFHTMSDQQNLTQILQIEYQFLNSLKEQNPIYTEDFQH